MIKHIFSGVLVSVLAAGTAVGASAVPATAAGSGQSAMSADFRVLHADFDAWQVTLQNGRRSQGDHRGELIVDQKSVGQEFADNVFVLRGHGYLTSATEYQIVMLGTATKYWIRAAMSTENGSDKADCAVYDGAPTAGGKPVADPSPFTCSVKSDGASKFPITVGHPRYTFRVGLNREVQASGSIKPIGSVSLDKATYSTYGLGYARHGDDSVATRVETTFDTVLRVGDKTPFENQARTEFAYQILDDETATKYWVAGLSTNWRGPLAFNGDSRCAIYTYNPLANDGQLDKAVPIKSSPYTCSAKGSYKHGPHEIPYNGHYFAQFTVRNRT